MKCALTISLVEEACGGPFLFWNLAEGCEAAARLGFSAVEVFPTSAEDLAAPELKGLLEKHDLKLAAMGTGAGWVKHHLRLTDPDPAFRRRAIDFVAAIIDLAGSFGAPAIVGSMQGRWEKPIRKEQALEWLAEAFEQLGPRANAHGVPLLYEFLNRYETNLLNGVGESMEFLSRLRTQNIKLLCDLFHMNIEEPDISGALEKAGQKLGHVHFVDSNRQAAGRGHIAMEPVFSALRKLGYSGYLSAEALPVPDSETAARQTITHFHRFIRNAESEH